jgi:hypothetical protein
MTTPTLEKTGDTVRYAEEAYVHALREWWGSWEKFVSASTPHAKVTSAYRLIDTYFGIFHTGLDYEKEVLKTGIAVVTSAATKFAPAAK